MTALPVTGRDGRPSSLAVICDQCGYSLADIDSSPDVWDVVWAVVSKYGWTGSSLIIGPHSCPDCSRAEQEAAPGPGVYAAGEDFDRRPVEGWGAQTHTVQDIGVVRLQGDLDVLVAAQLRDVLAEACDNHRHVVLDLSGVRLVDSTGLSLLVRTHQTVKRNGGKVCLAAPSRFLQTVLRTMRLHPVFPQFPTADAALAWLARSGSRPPTLA
jgi:anti-sigma B factor antagonist